MRPHRTYSLTQPATHLYINDYIDDSDRLTPTSIRRETRFPRAILALTLGLGLAVLVMLGTWLTLSTLATARATTFVAHPQEQTLSADELEGLPPLSLDDILSRF